VNYAQLLFPDFFLILCGYLVCRHTALNRTVWEQVETLVYYFLFPVLLFHSIVRSPLDLSVATSLIGAGLILSLAGIALAYSLPFFSWQGHSVDALLHAAGAQVSFRFNSYIALALADRLAGTQGVLMIAILIGFCIPLVNVGAVWPMARHAQRNLWRELARNPLIIATFLGVSANLMNFQMPIWLAPTATRLGAAAVALGLMSAGAGLRLGTLTTATGLSAGLLIIRHLLLPLVALGLSLGFELNAIQSTILLCFSALPTASSSYVLATKMGYDGAFVAGLVTLSTLLGMLSLPFALGVLLPLLSRF